MSKKISIIIPIYNKEKFLDKCIESIIDQTYKNIEIILVNDGSTDNSELICKKYTNKDNIKYFKTENMGVSNARNIGIIEATGDYVIFIDADDYIDKYYIDSLFDTKYDLVVEGFLKDYGNEIQKIEILEGIYSKKDILILLKQKRITNIFSVPYLKLFNLKIIKKYKIYFNTLLNFGEDFDFVLRYIKHIDRLVLLKNEYHYFNRIEKESLSRRKIPNIWNQMNVVFKTICDLYSRDSDRDYFFLRFLKITLLNDNFKEYLEFEKIFKEILNSSYFKKTSLKNFKIFSIDWLILVLLKLKFCNLAFIIFKLKRG